MLGAGGAGQLTVDTKKFQSTWIDSAEYDDETNELTVYTAKGGEYTLTGVPPDKWQGFKNAYSPGRYFDSDLKGQY